MAFSPEARPRRPEHLHGNTLVTKSVCEPMQAEPSASAQLTRHVFTFTQCSRFASSNPPTSTKHRPPNNLKSKVPR